jgi:hypothetical protein
MPKKTKGRKTKEVETSSATEKKYVSIREYDPELATKTRILWASVTALSLVVVFAWFGMLRMRIQQERGQLQFFSLINQISDSVKEFDKQISNSSVAIKEGDLNQIKDEVIQQLQKSPNSELWPTRQIDALGISLQSPEDWIIKTQESSAVLSLASSSPSSTTKINIELNDNAKKYSLPVWVEKASPEFLNGYVIDEPIFKFNETASDVLMYMKTSQDLELDTIYLLNSTSTKKIYSIKISAEKISDTDKKIIEEIVKTIKIIK